MNSNALHERALEIATRYRKAESELIEILQKIEEKRVFLARGHSSLFLYAVKELGLSESVAYNLISVARKAREVPELKVLIANGELTLSNARKIVPVLNPQNKAEWLKKASALSQRKLEREVIKIRPQEATPEKVSYVAESRVKLEFGLSEKDMLKLRRVQDLLCQKRRHNVSLEEMIVELTNDFLKHNDPLERARRRKVATGLLPDSNTSGEIPGKLSNDKPTEIVKPPVSLPKHEERGSKVIPSKLLHIEREPIPARVLHLVRLRDENRCQFKNAGGTKCGQTRWLDLHHKKPVSLGGTNDVENLETLCSAHHNWLHGQEKPGHQAGNRLTDNAHFGNSCEKRIKNAPQ